MKTKKDFYVYILFDLYKKESSLKELTLNFKSIDLFNLKRSLDELIENNLVIKNDKYCLSTKGTNLIKNLDEISFFYK